MTRIEVSNGASVSRICGSGHTEFLACFQYDCDAKDFAERKLAEDAQRGWLESSYAVSNTMIECRVCRCEWEHWRSSEQWSRGECFVPEYPCAQCALAAAVRSTETRSRLGPQGRQSGAAKTAQRPKDTA